MEIILIAGVARNGVIGLAGSLPWHISADLKRFKKLTVGNAVVMGHGTYNSIVNSLGKPLPDRLNIVLSRNKNLKLAEGVVVCDRIEDAVMAAADEGYGRLFIIGGQKVFDQFLKEDLLDKLELTVIERNYAGDAFFPEIDFSKWQVAESESGEENNLKFHFVSYQRIIPRIKLETIFSPREKKEEIVIENKFEKSVENRMENVVNVINNRVDEIKEVVIDNKSISKDNSEMSGKKGLFIVFDGIDGCGKSTQMKKLAEFIFASNKHNHVVLTREPYKDMNIRKVIRAESDPLAKSEKLAELFINDRKNHIKELIQPALDSGMIVISDRYKLSTIAYQVAQGSDINDMISRHKDMPVPDISFVIDIPASKAGERMANEKGRELHRFEANLDFLEKVRMNFHEAKGALPNEKIFIVDGDRARDEIFEDIKKVVGEYFISEFDKSSKESVGDEEIDRVIRAEEERQENTINLIPSENYASKNVINACANVLMNKYSEGYPFKRYYQGNKNADLVESIAVERAKKLFNAEHVNVQPYSGSPANLAVYLAFMKPGDKFMGLDLSCGGHLTHGSPVNLTGMFFTPISYGVDERGYIDMDKVREIALRERPKMIISGLTAYPRRIDFKRFQEIAEEVGAIHLADISHIAGLIAAGVLENPVPYTDVVMTTTHKTLRGPRGAMIMCKEKYAKQIDKAVFPGMQGGPHENVIAAKAVAFKEAASQEFKDYGIQIVNNAKVLAQTLMREGINIMTNGTDNHLILIDLRNLGIGLGREIAIALEEAGIVLNANTVPYDPSTPFKPSGLRLGTPMVTTRGFKEPEMEKIGKWIALIIRNKTDPELKARVKKEVENLCRQFPVYKK